MALPVVVTPLIVMGGCQGPEASVPLKQNSTQYIPGSRIKPGVEHTTSIIGRCVLVSEVSDTRYMPVQLVEVIRLDTKSP
jgi:hypothetical protein